MRLILMRHAHSDWSTTSGGDFTRPLTQRGRRAAGDIGKWLALNRYLPDVALCSTAARTRDTWSLVSQQLPAAPIATFRKSLYLAAPDTMFQALRTTPGDDTVMLVGHNPGCAILATALVEFAPAHSRFEDFPSAATVVIDFEAENWSALSPQSGQVVDFTTPEDQPSFT